MTINEASGLPGEDRPVVPQWNTKPAAGSFGRLWMRLAGVDLNLALEMPLDEQRIMQRVAGAALVGSAFQLFCILTALHSVAGITATTVTLAMVITSVLFPVRPCFHKRGLGGAGFGALCRAYGVIPEGGRLEKFKRPLAIGARWLLSFSRGHDHCAVVVDEHFSAPTLIVTGVRIADRAMRLPFNPFRNVMQLSSPTSINGLPGRDS